MYGGATDVRQPIGRSAQRLAQGCQRPRGSAINFTIGLLLDVLKDALALEWAIFHRLPAAVPQHDRRTAVTVEAGNELSNGVIGAAANRLGRLRRTRARCHGAYRFGTGNVAGRVSG